MKRVILALALGLVASAASAQTTTTNCTAIGAQLTCQSYTPPPPPPPVNIGAALKSGFDLGQRLSSTAPQAPIPQQAPRPAPRNREEMIVTAVSSLVEAGACKDAVDVATNNALPGLAHWASVSCHAR